MNPLKIPKCTVPVLMVISSALGIWAIAGRNSFRDVRREQVSAAAMEVPPGREPAFPDQAILGMAGSTGIAESIHQSPKLNTQQAEAFLAKAGRSPGSLLAAFRTSGNIQYLEQAKIVSPKDPEVIFEVLAHGNLSPLQRNEWLEALKKAAPANAAANYLSAAGFFRNGLEAEAIRELESAYAKPLFDDWTLTRMQGNTEAYRSNDFSEAQSRCAGMFQLPLPMLKEMRDLSENINSLSESCLGENDTASAMAAVKMAVHLGNRYINEGGSILAHQQLGWDIAQSALGTLDPGAAFGPDGETVQHVLDSMNGERREISVLLRETVPLQDRMDANDWIGYIDRMQTTGEPSAMRWLKARHGTVLQ